MAKTSEKTSQEWYLVDLMSKLEDDDFPLKSPLDTLTPKDEY
ncbi:11775_t:CDS:2 [Diversispora eburnea]|uniref:11775_t:CDS:1 n=1 Tax=Diversispora eburnea TaxID=1213867 RepID=A0A9N9FJA8_9GLOM|nr:11775_t:CDS:2 [Diversispora eburnea]